MLPDNSEKCEVKSKMSMITEEGKRLALLLKNIEAEMIRCFVPVSQKKNDEKMEMIEYFELALYQL